MSQSPKEYSTLNSEHEYLKNFDTLGKLIGQGKSFSGRERNCLFLNRGNHRFSDVSSVTGFDLLDDGRSLAITDWDGDGDLDFWMNNRTAPRIRFLRNQLQCTNQWLGLRLEANSSNRDAIGARVELHLAGDTPRTIIRTVRAGGGFLSQSSKWLHFGFLNHETIDRVVVRWPGQSTKEILSGLQPNRRYKLTQRTQEDQNSHVVDVAAREVSLPLAKQGEPTIDNSRARLLLTRRRRLPTLSVIDRHSNAKTLRLGQGQAHLIMLWASWCSPCRNELQMLVDHNQILKDNHLHVVALSTDGLEDANCDEVAAGLDYLQHIAWPFESNIATKATVQALTTFQHQLVYRELPLPLPVSFLIDKRGNVAAVYKGRLALEELIQDVQILDAPASQWAAAAFPFPGKSASRYFANTERITAMAHLEAGDLDDARSALQQHIKIQAATKQAKSAATKKELVQSYQLLSRVEQLSNDLIASIDALEHAIRIAPRQVGLRIACALTCSRHGDQEKAARLLEEAAQLRAPNSQLFHLVGKSFREIGRPKRAIEFFQRALALDEQNHSIRISLANSLQQVGDVEKAVIHFDRILVDSPNSFDTANNLAWILATCSNDRVRNPARAVELAQYVIRASDLSRPNILDTLAAAYAANQDYRAAVETISKAIALAEQADQGEFLEAMRARLLLYQDAQPYVETSRAISKEPAGQ